MAKIEIVMGQKYGDERISAMREYLEHIPDDEWDGVVNRTIAACKELPLVADFCKHENKRW